MKGLRGLSKSSWGGREPLDRTRHIPILGAEVSKSESYAAANIQPTCWQTNCKEAGEVLQSASM